MGSSEILSNWIEVGERMYQRTELYGTTWAQEILGENQPPDRIEPAPFGGPILVVRNQINAIQMHRASGPEIAHFRWRNNSIVTCGWSHKEDPVFVVDDGTVLIYSLFGEFSNSSSMGQEAKDVRLRDAKIFRGGGGSVTGVVVLTTSHRFYIVNNIYQPRIWKMYDLPNTFYDVNKFAWSVLAPNVGSAKVLIGLGDDRKGISCVTVLSQSDANCPTIEPTNFDKGKVVEMALATNGEHVALYFDSGVLWMGRISIEFGDQATAKRLNHMNLSDDESKGFKPEEFYWCGLDSVLCISPSTAQCLIASLDGSRDMIYIPGYMCTIQELDGARILTSFSQDWLQCIPFSLHHTCAVWSNSPGKKLLKAAEKFDKGSHKANEYIRSLGLTLNKAIAECIESAGLVIDPVHQKELSRAVQFGKAFAPNGTKENADEFSNVCRILRVLNALRLYSVGIPLTMAQFRHLTPQVVIDRLLARRLYALAEEVCLWLNLPPKTGSNRVLAHWARYRVGNQAEESATQVAKVIHSKLGNNPQIPYCDIASQALKYGKEDLAIRLLDYENSVNRQVPLLVTLGRDSKALALTRALKSGDRNLAYFVIWELRKTLPSTDFHMLIRKHDLGKVLYESYCQTHDDKDGLQDWYLQEDNFKSQAVASFKKAVKASNADTRMAQLINVQELFEKASKQQQSGSSEACAQLVDEQHKLLKCQASLESKIPGSHFVGMSLHQTLSNLLQSDENKLAEKVRSDFKVGERRFQWLKLKKYAVNGQFEEINKFCAKQRKKPIISLASIIGLVRQHGSSELAQASGGDAD